MAAGCLAGCGRQSASSPKPAANYPLPDPPVVANCQPGIRGGKFIISEIGDPKTFNPITQNEQSSYEIIRFMFWGLLNFDQQNQTVEPGLADFWTNSPDGKTWTLRLRKNLRWSDGAPLTADDVVFTWNDVIFNPAINNVTRDMFIINGKPFKVSKVDDLTVQVETPEVYAPFLSEFGTTKILPKHILEKSVADGAFESAYSVNWKPADIVGSGPYCLKEYKAAQYTILERNPYFLEVDTNGTRLPYFDDLIFPVVPDFDAMSLRFLSGEGDVDEWIYPYAYDTFKSGADQGKFNFLDPGVGLEMRFLCFNQNTNMDQNGKPYVDPVKLQWFRNAKFRQAVSCGINRQAILQSVYSGRGLPEFGPETPGDKQWYDPNTRTYPYDPQMALELLKEIGIERRNGDTFLTDAGGHRIEFVLNTNTGNSSKEKTGVLIAADLQKLGMKVIFQPIEFNTLMSRLDDTFNYDCALITMGPQQVADPCDNMNILQSSGYTHEWFPREKTPSTPWEARIDYLMDAQSETLDMAERVKDYDEVQKILAEQQPMIFLVIPDLYAAIRSDVGNVRPAALGGNIATWNAEELYYKK